MARPPITRARPYTPTRGAAAGQTFTSERQYRNALARAKGYASLGAQQRANTRITSATQLATMRPDAAETRARALDALSKMRRDGMSISRAARDANTTPNAVRRYAGAALTRKRGRDVARPRDGLYRRMEFLTPDGKIALDVTDSRTASRIGAHWAALKRYAETGDDRALLPFRGRSVRVGKRAYPFITDLDVIDELAHRGELSFESIYAVAA